MAENKIFFGAGEYQSDAIRAVNKFIKKFSSIICEPDSTLLLGVARGGLIQTQICSYMLENRNVEIISSRLYDDMVKNSGKHIISGLKNIYLEKYKNIIILDDIYDSGETMEAITRIVQEEAPKSEIFRVVTYTKQERDDIIYGKYLDTDSWVVFPWDSI